jgi:dolichol-phosphate mannosyltransferase
MFQQKFAPQAEVRDAPLELSVVIPTLNEAGNLEPLLERLGIALAGIEWEAIFVDDGSTDGTPEQLTNN